MLALSVFAAPGYGSVWAELTAAVPARKTLSLKVSDIERTQCWPGKLMAAPGVTGYPVIRLMTIVETGPRALFGSAGTGEIDYARALSPHLQPAMRVYGLVHRRRLLQLAARTDAKPRKTNQRTDQADEPSTMARRIVMVASRGRLVCL